MNKEIRKTALFKVVKDVIDKCDCEHLLCSGAPEDEYDRESEFITQRLSPNMTVPQISAVIARVMNEGFSTGWRSDDFLKEAVGIYGSFGALIDLRQNPPAFRKTLEEDSHILPDASFNSSLTPEELIGSMFRNTTPDGFLICQDPFTSIMHPNPIYSLKKFKMKWTEADCDAVKTKCTRLIAEIKACIGKDEFSEDIAPYLAPLSIDCSFLVELGFLEECELTYPRVIDDAIDDIVCTIEIRPEEATPQQEAAFDRYIDALDAEADRRVGKSMFSYDLIQTAMRLFDLIDMSAPKVVVDESIRCFAAALVIHDYAVDMEDLNV